eukprot:gnl/MRDRNA2_/MRDRNA2_105353_c0_seq1.p1 gnl/MRDRNA2_/MRDRNA2_105353_c0~~gnl/MRDRNA2_/MRDRNA2_105353_c0_seq1.p1  ORF type:complete len:235 (+),score=44.76 gnl/MRDRNA2_/MRDRNA2_105353_c0_seq1:94-798(+)
MSASPQKRATTTPGRLSVRKSRLTSPSGSPTIGTEEGIEELLQNLSEQAEGRSRPVGSAWKPPKDKTLEEKRKDVLDGLQAEKARHPKRKQWQGDTVSRQFCPIDAGYLVDLDPKAWRYETIRTRIDPNAKPTFRGASYISQDFGDASDVPVTPALTEVLVRNHKKYLAHMSRRRVEERLVPIPRAFDLQAKVPPWSAPPTQCRFFGFLDDVDPVAFAREKKVQTARFKDQTQT